MKNILVPTDFSDLAKNALDFAIKLARPLNCKIILYHTIDPILIASDIGEYYYPETEEEENVLNKKLDYLLEYTKLQEVKVDKLLRKGLLKDEIADVTEKAEIDLIITGTHGAKGVEAFLFGTNSVNIFEKVKCPVMIIPSGAKFKGIKNIMYATDFQYGDIYELNKICDIARPFKAQIIVTHVNTNTGKLVEDEELLDWFAEMGGSNIDYDKVVYKLIHNPNLVDGIDKAVANLDIDILCMSTTEKDFFKKLVTKSNTKEMAYHTTIPLVSLHLGKNNKLS